MPVPLPGRQYRGALPPHRAPLCARRPGVGVVSQCHARAVVCAARPHAVYPCAALRAGAQALGRRDDPRAQPSRAFRRCARALPHGVLAARRGVAEGEDDNSHSRLSLSLRLKLLFRTPPAPNSVLGFNPRASGKSRRVRGAVRSVWVLHAPSQWILRSMLPYGRLSSTFNMAELDASATLGAHCAPLPLQRGSDSLCPQLDVACAWERGTQAHGAVRAKRVSRRGAV